jgi:hypothetical protein
MVREGLKIIEKKSTVIEQHETEAEAHFRAKALNWIIISIEPLNKLLTEAKVLEQ